ncbi:MAG TPA: hypothetical protein VIF62_26120 [Labilithrix sp.]|jgi:hypothetical protein
MKSCERSFEVEDLALGACDAELESHVASCASCREALARFEEERSIFARREPTLDAPPDFTLAIDLRLRRAEALEALGRLAPLADDASTRVSRIATAPLRALVALIALVRAARAAYASWHVVHGVLGAAALAAAFLLVANAGGRARSASSPEASAEATSTPLFTSARIASFVADEPTTCFATDPSPASHAEPLACAIDSRAVCEPNAGP